MKSTVMVMVTGACALMMSACTSWPTFAAASHPECRSQSTIIYYNYEEEDLRVIARPAIEDIAQKVADCQNVGGELASVTIVGFPDRMDDTDAGDATATARGQAVLDALVTAGVPADKIRLASYRLSQDELNQPMRRRAEIAIEMR